MSRTVVIQAALSKGSRPTFRSALGVLRAGAEALLQLLGPLFGFHLVQAAEQRVQIAAGKLAIGLPLHGTGF